MYLCIHDKKKSDGLRKEARKLLKQKITIFVMREIKDFKTFVGVVPLVGSTNA
jgi:hypothetical protein